METILEATDLTKDYEDFSLRGVSLQVRRGSIAGLFGPNAAGKSTLIKLLTRQISPRSGTVSVFGQSYEEHEVALKNRVGYVPQEPAFYPDKTVQWTARFASPYFARWDGPGFYKVLDDFKVNPLKKVKHLSGGQKKLLSLALAFSHGADLLVLDEPTAGLDIVYRRALLDRLREFVADGERTVIVASHVTDGLDEIADEVWFLNDGRIVMHDDKDELLSRWKWIHFREGAIPRSVEDRLTNVRRQPFGSCGLTGEFPELRDDLSAVLAAGDAKVENARLEDVLLAQIKEA
jgi:ABC-2 type transport system ATP-binding protein